MLLSVVHSTRYRYATQVQRSTQYIRLTPWAGTQQRVIEWSVDLPAPCVTMRDAFDNLTHVLTLDRPHEELAMVARGRVEVADVDDGEPAGRVNPKVFLRATRLTEPDDDLRAFAEPMRGVVRNRPLIGLSDLMTAVLDRLPFRTGATAVDFTAAQSFAAGAGVAQDQRLRLLAEPRAGGEPRLGRGLAGHALGELRRHARAPGGRRLHQAGDRARLPRRLPGARRAAGGHRRGAGDEGPGERRPRAGIMAARPPRRPPGGPPT